MKTVITFLLLTLINTSSSTAAVKLQDLLLKVKNESSDISLKTPLPFINNIELRAGYSRDFEDGVTTQTDRDGTGAITGVDREDDSSESSSKELTLRVKLDNLKEYSLKRKLARNQKKRKGIVKGINQLSDAQIITELYITLNFIRKKQVLLRKVNTIYRDKVKVLRTKSRKGNADVVDYLGAVKKLESNSLELQKQKLLITNIVNTINSELLTNYKTGDFAQNEKLITLDYIESILNKKEETLGLSSKLAKYELERIDILEKLNSEKRNKILRFVDLRYQEGRSESRSTERGSFDDSTQREKDRRIGFRLGINLPWVSSDLESVDKSLEHILKKRKAKKQYYSEIESFESLKNSILNLIGGIKSLRSSKSLREAKKVLKVYSRQKGTAPLRLLKLGEFIAFEQIKKIDYELELYTRFYQYVYETNRLKLVNGQLVIKG